MSKLKLGVGALAIMVAAVAMPVKAYILPIRSDFEAWNSASPDMREQLESVLTQFRQESLKRKEMDYTDKVGEQGKGDDGKKGLQKVEGTDGKKCNQIITETRKSAKNGSGAISNTDAKIDISGLKKYSEYDGKTASSQSENDWLVHGNIGDTYSESQLKDIYEKLGTNVNDTATNAITYGAVETVNAAVDASQSDKEERSKQMGKGKELSSALQLMLGLDRRVYERSLHASAIEATAAGLEAIQVLQSVSKGALGESKI